MREEITASPQCREGSDGLMVLLPESRSGFRCWSGPVGISVRLCDHKGKCCSCKAVVGHIRVQLVVNRNLFLRESPEVFLSVSIAETQL